MNRWKLFLGILVVGCVVRGVQAEDKMVSFFGGIEYLTYSDAFEDKEGSLNDLGLNPTTSGGVGFRAGALFQTSVKGLKVGGSLGYILGPSIEGNRSYILDSLDINGDVVGTVEVQNTKKDESDVWRAMAETKYSVPLGNRVHARLGFGLGLATLHIENNSSWKIVETGGGESTSHSLKTTKLTWEIGPAIAYVGDTIGVELALTYAQMPSAEDMNTFQKFDWNPFGIRLGVEF